MICFPLHYFKESIAMRPVAWAISVIFASLPLYASAAPITLVQAGHVLDMPGKAPRGATTLVVEGGKISAVLDGFVGTEKYPARASSICARAMCCRA
jgi:hypothetical protein